MGEKKIDEMTYEEKEKRLDAILGRLDRSETPMDQLAAEAKEAAHLIRSMQGTLMSAKTEIAEVFKEMGQPKVEQLEQVEEPDQTTEDIPF